MGCGCKGSTPAKKVTATRGEKQQEAPRRERRTGLPGEPGYAWNGPKRR